MRVLIVLAALVATPFLAAMSQGGTGSDSRPAQAGLVDAAQCAEADANRSPDSWENEGQPAEKIGSWRRGCSPVPPSTCGPAPSAAGTQDATGQVRRTETVDGLPGWCLNLSGDAVGSAMTDGSGLYGFANLSPGTYLVCLVVLEGWEQTMPSKGTDCPALADGRVFKGRKFTLSETTAGAAMLEFRVRPL